MKTFDLVRPYYKFYFNNQYFFMNYRIDQFQVNVHRLRPILFSLNVGDFEWPMDNAAEIERVIRDEELGENITVNLNGIDLELPVKQVLIMWATCRSEEICFYINEEMEYSNAKLFIVSWKNELVKEALVSRIKQNYN